MRHFVKFELSAAQDSALSKQNEKKERLAAIFSIFGKEVSTRTRFTAEQTYAEQNKSDDDGDYEDDE